MEPATVTIDDTDDLSVWAADIAENLSPDNNQATVIGLIGPLGVGKTTFTQSLLKAYGVTDTVTSPTYTIESVYKLPQGPFAYAYHIDAYRLDGPEDLQALDFEDRLQNSNNIIIIEWVEAVASLLPADTLHIDMSFSDDESERRIMKLFYE